jgi:hypothetical protein
MLYLEHSFYGAETLSLWKVDQKYLKGFEKRSWKRMEKMGLTDCVRNEVFYRIKQKRIFYIQQKEGSLTGFVTSCVGTAF